MGSTLDTEIRKIILRAIASPDFIFRFDNLDSYWTALSTSTNPCVRDALEHVGDGRIAPSVFSLLVNRWPGEPVKLLKLVCQILVSNIVFSAILMSVGACRGRIRTPGEAKIVADNMEAYVAAYARQFGTRRLKAWVWRAFGPLVDSIRSPCIVAWVSPSTQATTLHLQLATEIEAAAPPTTQTAKAHRVNENEIDGPKAPAKRKGSDDSEPLPKRTKLQERTRVVLGDHSNGQVCSKRTKQRSRATQSVCDSPPALLQRMTEPTFDEVPPSLLRRMRSPLPRIAPIIDFLHQPPPGPLHARRWTASGIRVFASAMGDIGV
ncbi:hypothetical protein B0H11DRAFT_2074146, partial [Mycena galericulata]